MSQEDYQRHSETFHKTKYETFKCGKCYMNFSSKHLFQEHFKAVHESQMPIQNESFVAKNEKNIEVKNTAKTYGRSRIKCCLCDKR